MVKGFLVLVLAVAFSSPALADGPFDDYGYQLESSSLEELRVWHLGLPAVADAGQSFIGCSAAKKSTIDQFNDHFEICWTKPDQYGSCSHRCGASYHVFGFWTPNLMSLSKIDYVIFCRCNQVVHWYDEFPVPEILFLLGVAEE